MSAAAAAMRCATVAPVKQATQCHGVHEAEGGKLTYKAGSGNTHALRLPMMSIGGLASVAVEPDSCAGFGHHLALLLHDVWP